MTQILQNPKALNFVFASKPLLSIFKKLRFLLVPVFLIVSCSSIFAQTFNYGTGVVSGNAAPFNATSGNVTVTGNDATVGAGGATMAAGTYNFDNLTVNGPITVSGGTGPLIIRCTGTCTINSTISANGGNGGNGASGNGSAGGSAGVGGGGWGGIGGAGAAGVTNGTNSGSPGANFGTSNGRGLGGSYSSTTNSAGGGGGGAYGANGTNGTNGTTNPGLGGAGGTAYGDAALTTTMTVSSITTNLLGGSGGGGGGARGAAGATNVRSGGGGGGGGGAIQISAVTLNFGGSGVVSCRGGNGGGQAASTGGSGGGGSGGTINLRYLNISGFTAGTNSIVTGGTGGAQATTGGPGSIGRLLTEQDVVGCSSPGTQASGFSSPTVGIYTATISWTRGDGDNVLVIARAGSAIATNPVSTTVYAADAAYGSGDPIGSGFVVYNGSGTSVNLTNLPSSTTLHFAIYEYFNSGTCYNLVPLTGNFTTLNCYPATQATSFGSSAVQPNTATISWTRGSGDDVLVIARVTSAVATDPTDGATYTADPNYGSGSPIGAGFVVYSGAGTSVNLTGLTNNSTYHFAVYERNSTTGCYLQTQLTGSISTPICSPPLMQATGFSLGTSGSTSQELNWNNNGNPDGVIIVVRQGSAPTAPTQTTPYTDNINFGSGSTTAAGSYVVYKGNATTATVQNLIPSTQYYYAIYTYAAASNCYNTSSPITGNFTSASCSPVTNASGLSIGTVTNNGMTATWTRGSGTHVLVVARLTATSRVFPTYNASYTANTAFGSGNTTGTGNFVVYNGTGTTVSVTGMANLTSYTFDLYEYNASPNCYWFATPLTGAMTTLDGTTSGGCAASVVRATGAGAYTAITPTTTLQSGNLTNRYYQGGAANTPGSGIPIGFNFVYNGTTYTTFGLCTNGFIWFGGGVPNPATTNPISNASANLGGSGTIDGIISALGTSVNSTWVNPTVNDIGYSVTGVTPNRVLTIQWRGYTPSNAGANYISNQNRQDFQIILHENGGANSNKIVLAYADQNPYGVIFTTASAQVGLRGATNATFTNRTGAANNNWGVNAGTVNTDVCTIGSNNFLNGNVSLTFTQASTVGPNISVGTLSCPAGTVTLTADAGYASYQWFKDGVIIPGPGSSSQTYQATISGDYTVVGKNGSCYLQSNPTPVTVGACCTEPVNQVSNVTVPTITPNDATFNWTAGDGEKTLIILKQGSAVNGTPISPTAYTDNLDFNFGSPSGSQIGSGNYVMFGDGGADNATSATISGLLPGTTYHYAVYTYFASTHCYRATPVTGNFTTISCSPSTQPSSPTVTCAAGATMNLTFNRGNGARMIVLAKAGSAVDANPAYNTSYTANATFGSGSQIGTGNYVVYDGDATGTITVSLTGLSGATTYYFKAFEYNTSPNCYNLASPASISQLTEGGTYASATTTQNSTATSAGALAQDIVKLTIVTAGDLKQAVFLNSISFTTTGTTNTNDLTNAKIFYTGNSNTFSNATQFGQTFTSFSGTLTATDNFALLTGNNYFWIAYDIKSTAAGGNVFDATIPSFSITANGNTSSQTPSPTAPSGSRAIPGGTCPITTPVAAACAFSGCITACCQGITILSATLGNTVNSSGFPCNAANNGNGYNDNTSTATFTINEGSTYNMSINFDDWIGLDFRWAVWIDWNANGDFRDAGERFPSGTTTNDIYTSTSITVPTNVATSGIKMRIWIQSDLYPNSCPYRTTCGVISTSLGLISDVSINVPNATGVLPGGGGPVSCATTTPTVTTPVSYALNASPAQLSATGTNLLWYTAATGGTGSSTAPTPSTAATGTTAYYVSQNNGSCEGPRTQIAVKVSTSCGPAPYPITGGPYCGSGNVTLTNSETGVTYQLMNGVTPVGAPQNGSTGNILTFTPPVNNGPGSITYTVQGTNAGGTTLMTGSVIVHPASPAAPTSGGNVAVCVSAAPGTISASTTAGHVIDWYDAASAGTVQYTATNSVSGSSTFTLYAEARNTTTGCISPSRTPVTLTVNANPTAFNVTGGQCAPANVGVDGSEIGVRYQLIRASVATPNVFSNVGAPVNGTGNAIQFGVYNTIHIYKVDAINISTGCTTRMLGAYSPTICGTTWTGNSQQQPPTPTDWFDPTNWSEGAVPNNCGTSVTIPANLTHYPIIANGSGTYDIQVGNLTMGSSSRVTVASSRTLAVCGDYTGGSISNALVDGAGTLVMNGGPDQSILERVKFNTLQINNSFGVVLTSTADVSINNGLHLQTGNLDVSAGSLRLLSTSAIHSAYIDDFTLGYSGSITGNIKADRYIPIWGFNQHFMSSPVNSPAFSQMGASGPDGSYTVPLPTCDETQATPNSPYGTLFQYNDSRMPAGGCKLGNWMIRSAGNMDNGRGYSSYQKGDTVRTLYGAPNTGNLSVGGLNNKGTAPVPTLQTILAPIESGWNLVGNPYPSAINLTIPRAGFSNQVQVWMTSGPFQGSWQQYRIGIDPEIILAPFQAFMVLKTAAGINDTFGFYQAERVRPNSSVRFYRTSAENSLVLEVNYNNLTDITTVEFNPLASDGFDAEYDASKPSGSINRPMLFTHMNANRGYAINTLPSLREATSVPLALRPGADGIMKISAIGIQSFDPTSYIYLEDKKTGKWHNLRSGDYSFATTKTDNQDRFVLHFTPPAQIMTSDASCSGSGMIQIEQPGSANWNYTLNDNNNSVIASGLLNSSSPAIVAANAGVYTLTLTDNNGYTVMRNIQVDGEQAIVASFSATGHLAKVQEDITFTSHNSDAVTFEWNFGDGSTASTADATHRFMNEGVYIVSLTVINAAGCKSVTTQTVTITSREATGLNNVTDKKLNIWSSDNRVFIDFGGQAKVEAEIELYNVIGQLLSSEKFGRSSVYSKEIPNMEAAYVIVKVKNDEITTTKRVFIGNVK